MPRRLFLFVIRPGRKLAAVALTGLIGLAGLAGLSGLPGGDAWVTASSTELEMLRAMFPEMVFRVDVGEKVVALTFDDGPDPDNTPQVLNILAAHDVKCTFFLVGRLVRMHPEIARRIVAEGHEVGVHTYGHGVLRRLKKEAVEEDLDKAEAAFLEVIGARPRLLRFPQLAFDDTSLATVLERGYTVVSRSIDSNDWKLREARPIIANIVVSLQPGDVILMHDAWTGLGKSLIIDKVLDALETRGYRCVTVSELLRLEQRGKASGP